MRSQIVLINKEESNSNKYREELEKIDIYDLIECSVDQLDEIQADLVIAYFIDLNNDAFSILEKLNNDHITNIILLSDSLDIESQKKEIRSLSSFEIFTTLFAPIFSDKLASTLLTLSTFHNTLHLQSLENMESVVVITDRKHKIVYANNAFTESTGYTYNEVFGKTPNVLKSNKHNFMFYDNLKVTLEAGFKWTGEICNKKKDGQLFWEEARIFPVDYKGERYYVKTAYDITHKMNMINEKESDLSLAESIQRSLLPDDLYKSNITISGSYYPYQNVSGDIYKWMEIEDGKYCILLADVIGHGVGSALLTTGIVYMFKHLVEENYKSEVFLYEMNNRIMDMFKSNDLSQQNYFTAMYMIIDLNEKTITYSNCGHPKVYLIDEGELIGLQSINYPIGLFADVDFISETYTYKNSCEIFAFTDGLVESNFKKAENIKVLKELLNEYIENKVESSLMQYIEEKVYNPIHLNKTDDVSIITVEIREDNL